MAGGTQKQDEYAWQVGLKYGFATKKHSKYDMHYNEENEQYAVFANNRDGSNCLIKFKPEEFD